MSAAVAGASAARRRSSARRQTMRRQAARVTVVNPTEKHAIVAGKHAGLLIMKPGLIPENAMSFGRRISP